MKTFILENFQECQLQNAVKRRILGVFECGFLGSTEKRVKKSTVPQREIFLDQNFEKIEKNKNFHF